MVQALRQDHDQDAPREQKQGQLALYGRSRTARRLRPTRREAPCQTPVCAGCRAREARYGFREGGDDPSAPRPRTLCFDCFRMEVDWRQSVAARRAEGWNGAQVRLPLEETLRTLTTRRRRAQIAARHALGL
jgi:hypothetical protein